jgi:hypothetical protein
VLVWHTKITDTEAYLVSSMHILFNRLVWYPCEIGNTVSNHWRFLECHDTMCTEHPDKQTKVSFPRPSSCIHSAFRPRDCFFNWAIWVIQSCIPFIVHPQQPTGAK